MKCDVTTEQIESYRSDGFLVIEDWLTPGELEQWREAVDEAVAARADARLPGGRWKTEGEGYYESVFQQRINLWMDNHKVRALMLDSRIGKLAAKLEGVDAVRIWHDQALIKGPWANPTAWHLDVPYWSFSSRNAASIWIALDDATLTNGCLFFIPGSHKLTTFDNVGIGNDMGALFRLYPELAEVQSVAAPMRAGSCSFHNGLTAHGATANMTPGLRRAMTCAFMPSGSAFNGQQNVLPDELFRSLVPGDSLDIDEQCPLLYSSSGDA